MQYKALSVMHYIYLHLNEFCSSHLICFTDGIVEYFAAYCGFRIFCTLTKLEFGLKDLRPCTFQMEHSIGDHWSVALKLEKLNAILLK